MKAAAAGAKGKPSSTKQVIIEELKKTLQKNILKLNDLFKQWDVDGNGLVSRKEWASAMPHIGVTTTTDMINALFDEMDEDGSGSISYIELRSKLSGKKPAASPPVPQPPKVAPPAAARPPQVASPKSNLAPRTSKGSPAAAYTNGVLGEQAGTSDARTASPRAVQLREQVQREKEQELQVLGLSPDGYLAQASGRGPRGDGGRSPSVLEAVLRSELQEEGDGERKLWETTREDATVRADELERRRAEELTKLESLEAERCVQREEAAAKDRIAATLQAQHRGNKDRAAVAAKAPRREWRSQRFYTHTFDTSVPAAAQWQIWVEEHETLELLSVEGDGRLLLSVVEDGEEVTAGGVVYDSASVAFLRLGKKKQPATPAAQKRPLWAAPGEFEYSFTLEAPPKAEDGQAKMTVKFRKEALWCSGDLVSEPPPKKSLEYLDVSKKTIVRKPRVAEEEAAEEEAEPEPEVVQDRSETVVKELAKRLNLKVVELYPPPSTPSWYKLFTHMDYDRSGNIGFPEFVGMVRRELLMTTRDVTDGQLMQVWNVLDADSSGLISYDEFAAFMKLGEAVAAKPQFGRMLSWGSTRNIEAMDRR